MPLSRIILINLQSHIAEGPTAPLCLRVSPTALWTRGVGTIQLFPSKPQVPSTIRLTSPRKRPRSRAAAICAKIQISANCHGVADTVRRRSDSDSFEWCRCAVSSARLLSRCRATNLPEWLRSENLESLAQTVDPP